MLSMISQSPVWGPQIASVLQPTVKNAKNFY